MPKTLKGRRPSGKGYHFHPSFFSQLVQFQKFFGANELGRAPLGLQRFHFAFDFKRWVGRPIVVYVLVLHGQHVVSGDYVHQG